MRILIVAPKFNNVLRPQYHFPVGLANIKAALREKGHEVQAVNLNHKWAEGGLIDFISDKNFDVVMTGGLTAHYHLIREVFETAKLASDKIITIGGGGGFSSESLLFSEMTCVDYACIGEGEITICELIDAIVNQKDVSQIPGVVYKNEAGIYVENPARSAIENLDTLPFADYEGFDMESYLAEQGPYDYYFTYIHDEPRMFPIFMGRSCPYQCNFCFHPLGNTYRQRSLDNFFAELDAILDRYKVNSLAIFDELFSLREDRILEFCHRIKPYALKWTVQMRVNVINQHLLETMRAAGCFNISYGLESVNANVLKNMRKKITKAEIERALALTYQAGIGIQGNFIFGDEEEDMHSFSETFHWWRDHRKYQINLAFIETYPGTQLYKNAVQRGIIADRKKFIENNCPIINLTKQPEEVFQRMQTIVSVAEYQDREVQGEVIKIEEDFPAQNAVSATLRCHHCHEIQTIRRIPKVRIYSNNFKICCRHCNQKSVYDTRGYLNIRDSEFKYKLYFTILRQWMRAQEEGEATKVIESYLKSNSIRRIALLFDEELGSILYKALNKVDIEIVYIIDEYAESRYDVITADIPIIPVQSLNHMEAVDAVIVAEAFEFKKNKEKILSAGYTGRIISCEDVIFGIEMQ